MDDTSKSYSEQMHYNTCYPYHTERTNKIRNDYPVIYYIHLILFIIFIIYIISSTYRFWHFQKVYTRLEKRPFIFIVFIALGASIEMINCSLHPIVEFPSIAIIFIRALVVQCLAYPILIRFVHFYNRFILAQALLDLKQQGMSTESSGKEEAPHGTRRATIGAVWKLLRSGKTEEPNNRLSMTVFDAKNNAAISADDGTFAAEVEKNAPTVTKKTIKTLKFLSSNTLYIIVFVILMIPIIAGNVSLVLNEKCYNIQYPCYDCPRLSSTVNLIIGGIILVATIFFAILVRKLPDPFGFLKEIWYLFFFVGIPSVICVVLAPRFEDGFSKYFSLGWIIACAMVAYQFITTDLQIIIAKKDATERRNYRRHSSASPSSNESYPSRIINDTGMSLKASLEATLNNPEEFALFERHLVSEFAVETITMYMDCLQFSRTFFDMNESTKRARAKRIIQQHVADDAVMQVNLPYNIKMDLLSIIQENKPITKNIFDAAQKEIMGMLQGSYLRYKNSELYKKHHPELAMS